MKDIEKEEKKKSNGLLITILVVLLMAACVGGGYLLGASKIINNNKSNAESENVVEEDEENNDDTVVENVNLTEDEVKAIFDNLDTLGTTVETNKCGFMTFDYYKDTKVTVNDISNNTVSYVVLNQLMKSGFKFDEGTTFTKKQVSDIVSKTFGKDYSYEFTSIDNCPSITYDSSTELYTVGISGCGGTCGVGNLKKIDSYEVKGNTLEVMVRVLFSNSDPYNLQFFRDYNKTKVVDVNINDLENAANFAKGALYKLVFTQENGNYVFVSSEPIV